MKQRWYWFILLAVLLLIAVSAYGQNLDVPTLKASGLYLNDVIANDSVAAKAGNRTYVLHRDSVYYVNAVIRNVGWPLRLVAGTNGRYKPSVFFVLPTGLANYPTQMVEVDGSLYLQNIQVSGDNELTPTSLAGLGQNIFLTNASGFDIVIDSCILAEAGQGILRTTSAPRIVKVTNSIFANMGYCGTFDPGNGRAIDLRTGSCDSLIVINNTFVNNGDRVIRHYSSTAPIKYMLFDHNTVVNNYAFHGMMALGITGYKMIITNNFFLNPFALGNDTDVVRQAEFTDSKELDAYGQSRMVWIQSVPNDTTVWTIRNNYYSVDAVEQAWYASDASRKFTGEGSPLTWAVNKKLGADSVNAFKKVTVALTKVPEIGTAFMDWYRSPSGANKTKSTSTWTSAKDYNRVNYAYLEDSLNCKYPTSASIYTAADHGQPVGALTWWNMTPTNVEKVTNRVPVTFSLDQNYPNPFNPTTTLEYSISRSSHVVLEVFNVLGQSVGKLVNEQLSPGSYKTTFDASALSSGVYFYRLSADNFVQTKKMILMK